jgi:hypothetical protein
MNKMLTITLLVSLFAVNASFGAFKGKWVASQAEDIKGKAEQIHKISKSERIRDMAQNISDSASELHESGKSAQQNDHGNGQDASDVSGEYSGEGQGPGYEGKAQQNEPGSEGKAQQNGNGNRQDASNVSGEYSGEGQGPEYQNQSERAKETGKQVREKAVSVGQQAQQSGRGFWQGLTGQS